MFFFASDPNLSADALQLFQYVSTFATTVGVIAGILWYVFKGKNLEQLKDSNAQWKDIAEANKAKVANLQTDMADLKTKIADLTTEVGRLERKIERMERREEDLEKDKEELKKDNLRLKAIVGEK